MTSPVTCIYLNWYRKVSNLKKLLIQSLFNKLTKKPKLFKTKVFTFFRGIKQYLDIKVILQSGDFNTVYVVEE